MKRILSPLLVAASVVPFLAGAASAQDGWWNSEAQPVPFERILADPLAYRDVAVILTLQFTEPRAAHNPYFTAFSSDRFANFAAWPDSAELWDREQYVKPYGYFFVARSDAFVAKLKDLPQRTRFSCKAVVRSVFRGDPWIEISSVNLHPEAVTGATVREGFQGMQEFDKGEYDKALAHFEAALATRPGDGPAGSLWFRIAQVHWKRHDLPRAREALAKTLAADPAYPPALSLKESIEAAEKRLLAIPVPNMPGKAPPEEPVKPAAAPVKEPKVEPKAVPRAEPKALPKAEPKAPQKTEPKAPPKAEPEVKVEEEPAPPPPETKPTAPKKRPAPPK